MRNHQIALAGFTGKFETILARSSNKLLSMVCIPLSGIMQYEVKNNGDLKAFKSNEFEQAIEFYNATI